MSEKAESPLGRLNLKHKISDAQYDAGELYARIVGKYRSVIGSPSSTSGSGRGYSCDGNCGAMGRCECEARKGRYDQAFAALMQAGQRVAKVVARVAVHREEIAAEDFIYLDLGLSALARHFGLTCVRN